mmetsp:Transcript_4351/g.9077  ORF Transcript_4351/g.9077 Transcript_4351/m.9077 type:complete len:217 (-) Transcript_4351:838-1488(-)
MLLNYKIFTPGKDQTIIFVECLVGALSLHAVLVFVEDGKFVSLSLWSHRQADLVTVLLVLVGVFGRMGSRLSPVTIVHNKPAGVLGITVCIYFDGEFLAVICWLLGLDMVDIVRDNYSCITVLQSSKFDINILAIEVVDPLYFSWNQRCDFRRYAVSIGGTVFFPDDRYHVFIFIGVTVYPRCAVKSDVVIFTTGHLVQSKDNKRVIVPFVVCNSV